MKKQLTGLLESLSKNEVMNLTREVKEMLAAGYEKNEAAVFNTADLWNLQRRQKKRPQRRYF